MNAQEAKELMNVRNQYIFSEIEKQAVRGLDVVALMLEDWEADMLENCGYRVEQQPDGNSAVIWG